MSGTTRAVTWSALLARWMDFAKAAVALPRNGESGQLRDSVPSLIGLQAVTHALAELGTLPAPEQALALDKADVLVQRYGADLDAIWRGTPPAAVGEFVRDASLALGAARLTRPS